MSARKQRPARGTEIAPGTSERDIAAALGKSRRFLWQCKQVASIPEDEFEALYEGDNPPTITELVNVARRRAGLRERERRCPHCGHSLQAAPTIEAVAP
jgi:hypothetical protein